MTDITGFSQAGHDRIAGPPVTAGGSARHLAASLTWMSLGACRGEDPCLLPHRRPRIRAVPDQRRTSSLPALRGHRDVPGLCTADQPGRRWGGTTQEERRAMTERHRLQVPAAPAAREPARAGARPASKGPRSSSALRHRPSARGRRGTEDIAGTPAADSASGAGPFSAARHPVTGGRSRPVCGCMRCHVTARTGIWTSAIARQ